MLIRSQNKSVILNMDMVKTIYVSKFKEEFCIYVDEEVRLGRYRKEETARKVLDSIRQEYQYNEECKYIGAGAVRPEFVFCMPEDKQGYPDPTAGHAVREADKPPEDVRELVRLMRDLAHLTGYSVMGRITIRDKETGREWR